MKYLLPVLLWSLMATDSSAQQYAALDEYALNTPPSQCVSVPQLARYLNKAANTDTEKARVIYAWLTLNVQYVDSTAGASLWLTPADIQRQKPSTVLRNRTAVCQGYANLFVALAREMGLKSEVITGICRQPDGVIPLIGHAWTAAQIDGEWRLFDPTWGVPPAGEIRWKPIDQYFIAEPARFVLQHLPEDPMWQLLEHPISEKDFRQLSAPQISELLVAETGETFNFQDTLALWARTDSSQRFEAAIHRMLYYHDGNERLLSEIGRFYYMRFYGKYIELDSMADEAIMTAENAPDSTFFLQEIASAKLDFDRANGYFEQIFSPERKENLQVFLTETEVKSLMYQLNGDLYVAIFECDTLTDEPESEFRQLLRWQYMLGRAEYFYEKVHPGIDCRKHQTHCQSLLHNRSLIRLKLGQRWVSWLAFGDKDSPRDATIGTTYAQNNLNNVMDDLDGLMSMRPVFEYVEKRRQSVIEQLSLLNLLESRQKRQTLMQEVEDFLQNKPLQMSRGSDLLKAMKKGLRHIESSIDTVEHKRLNISEEYRTTALQNLYGERLVQLINTANLEYRLAINLLQTAYEADFQKQKNESKQYATQGIDHLKSATSVLNQMHRAKMLTQQEYRRRENTITTLQTALNELTTH